MLTCHVQSPFITSYRRTNNFHLTPLHKIWSCEKVPSKLKNEAKRGPEKSEEWWACATNERHRGAETLFDRNFRRQRGQNPHARHVQYLLWQPGVRSPPPVSNKRALSGLKPRHWASRARIHTRRPVPAKKISAAHQLGTIGIFEAAGTTEASAAAVPQGCQLRASRGSPNISHVHTQLGRHRWARAAEGRGHAQPVKAQRTA